MQPSSLAILDHRTLFRQGLTALMRDQRDLVVVGEAGDADEAHRLCMRTSPDLVLLDAALQVEGELLLPILRADCPFAAIVVMGGTDDTVSPDSDRAERLRWIEMGAQAFLRPTVDQAELLRVLRGAASRNQIALQYSPNGGTAPQVHSGPRAIVTDREFAIINLVREGLSNKEIAARLDISTQTVKIHISHLLKKLALADRTQIAVYAIEHRGELPHPKLPTHPEA